MQKLSLILLLVITTYLYAKVEIVRSYYESGELFSQVKLVDGKPVGVATIFYKNGNIKREGKFVDGQETREYKTFYENGDIENIRDDKESYYYPKGSDYAFVTGNDPKSFSFRLEFKEKNKKDEHIKYAQDGLSMEFDIKDNEIDGLFTTEYMNETSKLMFKKGKKDGLFEVYRDGKLYTQMEFKDDKREGVAKEYYSDGTLKSIVYYKNDKPHKEAIKYTQEGLISSKIVIHDNNQTTKYIYSKDGDLVSSYSVDIDNVRIPSYNDTNGLYSRDKPQNQLYRLYYSNGSLREEVNTTTNKGEARGYYRDGKLRYIIPYIKDNASGEAQYFDKNQTLLASIEFKENAKNGITKIYYPDSNKTLKYRLNYQYNSLNGTKTKYLKDGSVDYNITYTNNHIDPLKNISYRDSNISRVCYYENNNTEYNISIQKSGKSVIKAYYPNGDIEFEIHYIDGEKNGTTSIYYGQREFDDMVGFYRGKEPKTTPHTLRTELEFISNRLNGTAKIYNTDGKLREEIEYKNSIKHGMSIDYSNGRKETPYIDGKKDGKELHYQNGELISETRYKNNKKDGVHIQYHKDKIWVEESYKDGKKDGYHRLILEGGRILYEHLYKDDKRVLEREVVE